MSRNTPEYRRQYYLAHKEQEKENQRRWRAENPDKPNEMLRAWRAKNPDKVKESLKRNGDKIIKQRREAYNTFKESIGCLNPACEWKGSYKACMLDFHHVKQDEKSKCVSQMLTTPDKMKKEIRKCTLLCANCHRLVTWGELDDQTLPLCEV